MAPTHLVLKRFLAVVEAAMGISMMLGLTVTGGVIQRSILMTLGAAT